jgi:16S rRNA (adenine1518-N6/adenine1519-N6)-dimethyltransferase
MTTPEKKPRFAKKSLGQNFLVDKSAIAKIVAAVPPETPLLLEIGPGRGALSTELFSRARKFCLLEKDDLFAEKIAGTLFIHGSRNHHVFHADALDFDWNRLWSESESPPETPLTVAANLPYNVATEILFRLLALNTRIPLMVLMFQKEVGVRIAAQPGGRDYGILSVAAQNLYDVKIQQVLKPGAFRPSPKVDSVVLEFHRRSAARVPLAPEEQEKFLRLVKAAFAHRRKTLENSLNLELSRLGWVSGKAALHGALEASGIAGIRRAETLSLEEFGRLFHALR